MKGPLKRLKKLEWEVSALKRSKALLWDARDTLLNKYDRLEEQAYEMGKRLTALEDKILPRCEHCGKRDCEKYP